MTTLNLSIRRLDFQSGKFRIFSLFLQRANKRNMHAFMQNTTHQQRVLDLLQQQELLRASDLDAIGAPRVVLSRLTTSGQLERVGRGLYRLPGGTISEHESLATPSTPSLRKSSTPSRCWA